MGQLLYGSGLRLMKCLRLRVKDVDFSQQHIIVRDGKGFKDRVTLLPELLQSTLQTQMGYAQALHKKDLADGYGRTSLSDALAVKYPNADREWGWQYVFPSTKLAVDRRDGLLRRHHLHEYEQRPPWRPQPTRSRIINTPPLLVSPSPCLV